MHYTPLKRQAIPWWAPPTSPPFLDKNLAEMLSTHPFFQQLGLTWLMQNEDCLVLGAHVSPATLRPSPFILHGGISCYLIETITGIGSNLCIDPQTSYAVGLDLNANHLKMVEKGNIYAVGSAIHLGKTSHIWHVELYNGPSQDLKQLSNQWQQTSQTEQKQQFSQLISQSTFFCVGRMTNLVLKK